MCKVPVKLRELVKQRLAAAAEEIFELLERTITEYEEELICKYDQQRKLDKTVLCTEEFKGERGVSMKSEEEEALETWTQPVHHNQTVDCPEPPVPVAASGDHLLHLNNTEAEGTRGTQSDIYTLENIKTEPLFIDQPQEGDTTFSQNTLSPAPIFCPICSKACVSRSMLQRHMRVHTRERPYSCSVCGKRFAQKGNMEQHMRIHCGSKSYSCTFCGKAFAQKSNLNNHLLIHTSGKPFSCSVCEKSFSLKGSLQRHIMVHMSPNVYLDAGSSTGPQHGDNTKQNKHKGNSKCLDCPICGKAFSANSLLERHLRVHTGEKPFSCSVCGKRFTRRYHVRSHMKIHTEDEPYSCSVCGKSFTASQGLNRHMASHKDQPAEGGSLIYCSIDD